MATGGADEGEAAGKVTILGLLREGKIYTSSIVSTNTETLISVTEELVQPDSIVDTDSLHSFSGLAG